MKKTSGASNIAVILLVVVSFFAGYLFFKTKSLEQKVKVNNAQVQGVQEPTQTDNQQAAQANPLAVNSLKKYANEMSLDSNKFNNCLDKDEKKQVVLKELEQGSSLGVRGTPGFFINGRFLGGAFPFESFKEIIDKEIAGRGSNNYKDYSENLQQAYLNQKSFDPEAKKIDLKGTPPKGASKAKVAIVEFSDFQCPFCVRAYPTVKQILQAYPNDVQIYYKQFPLTQIHPFAQKAAEASLCADDQGKFWEYANKLFEVQGG